jgi:hypothetical protein
LNTSAQTSTINPMISHAAALPNQVLMPSIVCRRRCAFMRVRAAG